ncbi:hypothetical protein WA026_000922 [Henosepilachna vigintioctopunctata]|uniref:Uncharacterized protein n=1 Tax=Henosepilachna vigintioctopunctata TaxID=420089 RepID=A0AAW1V8R6_9CUCU
MEGLSERNVYVVCGPAFPCLSPEEFQLKEVFILRPEMASLARRIQRPAEMKNRNAIVWVIGPEYVGKVMRFPEILRWSENSRRIYKIESTRRSASIKIKMTTGVKKRSSINISQR